MDKEERKIAIQLLKSAEIAFGQKPISDLHNTSGICWFMSHQPGFASSEAIQRDIFMGLNKIKTTEADYMYLFTDGRGQSPAYRLKLTGYKTERAEACRTIYQQLERENDEQGKL